MLPGATLGLLFGVWLFQQQAQVWSLPVWLCWLLALLVTGLLASLRQLGGRTLPLAFSIFFRQLGLMLLVAAIGFAWAQGRAAWRLQAALPQACEQQPLKIQGVIVSVPARDARGQHVDVAVERDFHSHCPVPPRLRLHLYEQSYRHGTANPLNVLPQLQAGERWQLTVKLKRPHATRNPHGFDYAAWCLANQIGASGSIVSNAPMRKLQTMVWQPAAIIARWRAMVGERIQQVLGATPASGVLRALVIGDDSQILRPEWQLFVDTGINHLISISGLHITMLAALGYVLTGWLWRHQPRLALWLPSTLAARVGGALVAVVYSALAGFSIPTQRTLWMLLTMLGMLSLRRQLPFSWILSVALWVVVVLDPWAVLAPGFWLSFGAVALLAFGAGGRLRPAAAWRSAIETQWMITLAFVPILILLFNQVSLVSPLANAIAIPLVSVGVVPLAIAGAVLPIDVLLTLAAQLWQGLALVLHWLGQLSWAVWYLPTPSLAAWGVAMLGMGMLLLPKGWPLRWCGLVLWLPLCVPSPSVLQPGDMRVTVLDIGQGLSVLVQTATHAMLYDAGPIYHEESDAGQRIVLPYLRHLGLSQLDLAVVSHDDNDHVGGMASVLAGVPAIRLLSSLSADATFFKQLKVTPHTSSMPRLPCQAGQHWQWDQVSFKVLYPLAQPERTLKDNDKSCVVQVISDHGSVLLTGDIEQYGEQQLLQHHPHSLASNVITMPHHGSKTSSSPAFVEAVQPDIAIATVGYLNRFGHPKQTVLSRYEAVGSQLYRSDQHGAVVLDFIHGDRPAVLTWRQVEPHYWD